MQLHPTPYFTNSSAVVSDELLRFSPVCLRRIRGPNLEQPSNINPDFHHTLCRSSFPRQKSNDNTYTSLPLHSPSMISFASNTTMLETPSLDLVRNIHASVSSYIPLNNMVCISVCQNFTDTGRMLLTVCGMFVLVLDRS